MKQFIGFLGFIALLIFAWVSMIGPRGGTGGIPQQEVDLLPEVTFLGEGPGTFNIDPDHTFVIKYRRNLDKKFPLIGKGPNPFIDPAGYVAEIDMAEAMFRAVLAEQQKAAGVQ